MAEIDNLANRPKGLEVREMDLISEICMFSIPVWTMTFFVLLLLLPPPFLPLVPF
jgi:hypothetical protein